ncbi:MAG: sensor histidine kinase [Desulfobacterales bacterium]|nr:sensor histidine kinase [Desulfobacterales bacterium]
MEYINFIAEYYKTSQLSGREKRILFLFLTFFILICMFFFLFINLYSSKYNYLLLICFIAMFSLATSAILIKSMVRFYLNTTNNKMVVKIQEGMEAKYKLEALEKNIDKIVSERTLNLENANFSLIQTIEVRNQIEKSLLESKKRYFALFNNNPVAIVTVDKNLKVTSCNIAKIKSGRTPINGDVMYVDYAAKHEADMYAELKECIDKGVEKDFPELKYNNKYLNIRMAPFFDGAIIASINITDIKNAEKTVHVLTREILRKQEMERRNIALNLHDNVAQELASLKISCDSIMSDRDEASKQTKSKVANFSKVLQGSISSVRNIAYELQPPNLSQLGLSQTIFRLCEDFTEQNNIVVKFHSAGIDNLTLNFETSINIFRLVQEALTNIKKYAGPTIASVKIVAAFPNIIIRIDDFGKGFNVTQRLKTLVDEKKTGIQNMKERAGMLGGNFKLRSEVNRGTKIHVEIPMPTSELEKIENQRVAH